MRHTIGAFLFASFLGLGSLGASYAAPGDLDAGFGTAGRVMTYFNFAHPRDIVVQPDGKIIAVGRDSGINNPIVLVRYNPDGSLDGSFGVGGKVATIVGQFNEAAGVALLPDGRIVIAGEACAFGPLCDFVAARYLTDGSLDTSFDGDGKVTIDFGNDDSGNDVAIQSDGKIFIAGRSGIPGARNYAFAVARLNVNGSLDTSFDGDGRKITSLGGYSDFGASAVAIQSDGRIVVAGDRGIGPGYSPTDFALVRYDPDGSLDTTFSDDGIVTTSLNSYGENFTNVAVQPDGKIVGVGHTPNYAAVIRYESDGDLDSTFDGDGVALTDVGPYDFFSAVAVQPDGKVLAGGFNREHVLVRYSATGALDTSFGGDGIVTTGFDNNGYPEGLPYGGISSIAIQADGQIVTAGGWGLDGEFSVFALSRYLGDAAVPVSTRFDFDGDGKADVSVFRPSDRVWYLNQSTNGFFAMQFGLSTDRITPADFDGDGKTDISVYRDGTWYWLNSSNNSFNAVRFGLADDIPLPADFTGEGRDELAVYRDGDWWMLDLLNNQVSVIQFGISTDRPVVADYDGDGRVDQAVYRNGEWHLNRSAQGYAVLNFGLATDRPLVGDYDGDAKADQAVYRNGTWHVNRSQLGYTVFGFGLAADIPAPADYDGDGRTDAAVFREGTWYVLKSSGGVVIQAFGLPNDTPIPSAYIP